MYSLLPGSTTASRHSIQSKSASRTSVYDDLEDQDTEDTEQSHIFTTTSPPTKKKSRPLSQTRSFHSIFSIRGSVRNLGPNSRTSTSTDKEGDEEEAPIDTPKEDEATANEAVEDTEDNKSTNNVPSKTEKEEQKKISAASGESSSASKSPLPKTSSHSLNLKEGRAPNTSSGRSRRPLSSTLGSSNQKGTSSSLPNSQGPVVKKKVYTSFYPEDKVSTTVAKLSTPSPQETKVETERESSSSSTSSSLSSPSAGASRVSTPSHASNSGPGSVYPNGRRVNQLKGHKYQTGRQKSALTSSSTVSSTDDQDIHSASIMDTKHNKNNDHKIKNKNNEDQPSSYQYTTTSPPSIKEENTPDLGNNNYKDKAVNSYLPSSQIPSIPNPGHGSSLSNSRNSRIVVGSSQRKDGRIPWVRTASSVGAGRPILRGLPSNPTASREHVNGKINTSPTIHTTKHLVDSNPANPTVNNRQAALNNGQTISNDHILKEDTNANNNNKHDYLSEVSKKNHEVSHKNSAPTASPKTASQNSSYSSSMTLNRLGIGSNGKVRSAFLASRLNQMREQNAQTGTAMKQNSSSSSISTSSSSSVSQTMESKALSSDQVTGGSQNANVRSTVGLGSRLSQKQPATDQNSAPARNPVVRSRYPSRSEKNVRGKTPMSFHKPIYGQGKLN